MDGLNCTPTPAIKRVKYLLMKCSVSAKTIVRDLHAADLCYHLDCWFGVTVK